MLYNGKQSHGSASATEEEMSKAKDVGEQKEYKTKGTQVPAKKGFLCMKGFLKRGRGGGGGPSGSHKQTELLLGQRTLTPFLLRNFQAGYLWLLIRTRDLVPLLEGHLWIFFSAN